jgi:hypothetical protein
MFNVKYFLDFNLNNNFKKYFKIDFNFFGNLKIFFRVGNLNI